jgi:predicted nucleic acid-binding protein
MILLDTNILTASKQSGHPDFVKVTDGLKQFITDDEDLVICPQNLYEFFVASTRPKANRGLGLSKEKALEEIESLKNTYRLIADPENLFDTWLQVINDHEVSGKQGHDARLAAFMVAHGIDRIYTMNIQDFNRYAGIITILN